jgi:hypothetical protein
MKKVKRSRSFLVGLFSLMTALAFAAEAPKILTPPKTTGADWLIMAPQEKVQCVNSAIAFLRAKGIPIEFGGDFYGSALNNVVDQPGAEKTAVINLVTTLVYNKEPQARPMINQLRIKPGKKSPEPANKTSPKRKQIV